MSLINQLSEAVVGNKSTVEKCPFCGAECRLHHLAEGDRVECLTCKYKSPIDIYALRKHNRVSKIMNVAERYEQISSLMDACGDGEVPSAYANEMLACHLDLEEAVRSPGGRSDA